MADIGSEIVLQAQLRNRAGVLTDPDTVRGWVKAPSTPTGTIVAFTRKSVGLFEAVYTPSEPGEHWWRIETTGPVKTAEERKFVVEEQHVPLPNPAPNLFVQAVQPLAASIKENSLWIPLLANGAPAPIDLWEVFTGIAGVSSGDGGNLFVQTVAPTPAVDSLWVPLNADGTAKAISQWVVYTGFGPPLGYGNLNLYIQVTRPSTPIAGSLWIPLNVDLTPKSVDLWEVYA